MKIIRMMIHAILTLLKYQLVRNQFLYERKQLYGYSTIMREFHQTASLELGLNNQMTVTMEATHLI